MDLTLHEKEELLREEFGLTFGAIVAFAALYGKTFSEAVEISWETKVHGKRIDPLTGDLIQ